MAVGSAAEGARTGDTKNRISKGIATGLTGLALGAAAIGGVAGAVYETAQLWPKGGKQQTTPLDRQRIQLEGHMLDRQTFKAEALSPSPGILARHSDAYVAVSPRDPADDTESTVTEVDRPIQLYTDGKIAAYAGIQPYIVMPEMPGEGVGFVAADQAKLQVYDSKGNLLAGREGVVAQPVTLRFRLTATQLVDHPGLHGFTAQDGHDYGLIP